MVIHQAIRYFLTGIATFIAIQFSNAFADTVYPAKCSFQWYWGVGDARTPDSTCRTAAFKYLYDDTIYYHIGSNVHRVVFPGTSIYGAPDFYCLYGKSQSQISLYLKWLNSEMWQIDWPVEVQVELEGASRLGPGGCSCPIGREELYINSDGTVAECRDKTKPTLTLTLTPAPNQKDPRPKGTETKDDKSTYELIAKVMEGSTPKAGVAVTFAVEVEPNTGGHDHHDASRPKGLVNGKLTASGITGANGEIKVTFQASQIAGTHVVAAVCESCTNKSVTKNVDVKVPDLVPFLALPFRTQQWNPEGIGQTVEHRDNHYLTVAATYRLLEIATKYKKIWPTAPTLTLNDGSLKWGGKFDIFGTWDRVNGKHGEHRIGDNIDIRANSGPGNVPANIREAVFRWLSDESASKDNIPAELVIRSVNPLWENPKTENEHFHLRLGN